MGLERRIAQHRRRRRLLKVRSSQFMATWPILIGVILAIAFVELSSLH
jgi:hypothetical protein